MTIEKMKTGTAATLKAVSLALVGIITKELWEGQPLAGLTRLRSYRYILTSNTPFWVPLCALIVIGLLVPYWWRAIRKKESEIYVAWHGSAGWGIGGILETGGMEKVLRIQGPVTISSSNFQEPVIVTGIELKDAEYAGPYFQMFEVKPGETTRNHFMLNFRGPVPERDKALTVNLTLIDITGKRYPLSPAALRAFPSEGVLRMEPAKPKVVVNTAWRVNLWCWAQVDGKKLVRIVSEGLMQFTNIGGRIIITSARVNGVQAIGAFDTFPAEPGKEFYRSISLNVEGIDPQGKVPLKAAITLTDLQGNEYPLREETFTPSDEPKRLLGGLAWPENRGSINVR